MDYKRATISPYREFEKHSQDSLVLLGKLQKEPLIIKINICLSNREFERLGDPIDEIVIVFVHKHNVIMPRHNMMP